MKRIFSTIITFLLILSFTFNSFAIAQMDSSVVSNLVKKGVDDKKIVDLEDRIKKIKSNTQGKIKNNINDYLSEHTPFIGTDGISISKKEDSDKWEVSSKDENYYTLVMDDSLKLNNIRPSDIIEKADGRTNIVMHFTTYNIHLVNDYEHRIGGNIYFEQFYVGEPQTEEDEFTIDTDVRVSLASDVYYFNENNFIVENRINNDYSSSFMYLYKDGEYKSYSALSAESKFSTIFPQTDKTKANFTIPSFYTLDQMHTYFNANYESAINTKSTFVCKLGYDDYHAPSKISANPLYEYEFDDSEKSDLAQILHTSYFLMTVYNFGEDGELYLAKGLMNNSYMFSIRYNELLPDKWSGWSQIGTAYRDIKYTNGVGLTAWSGYPGSYQFVSTNSGYYLGYQITKVGQLYSVTVRLEYKWTTNATTAGNLYTVMKLNADSDHIPFSIYTDRVIGTLSFSNYYWYADSSYANVYPIRDTWYLQFDRENNCVWILCYVIAAQASYNSEMTVTFKYIASSHDVYYMNVGRYNERGAQS